ncbi:MAG: hypothetical protein J6N21_21505 [Butyrivibrio sp.]|nr:hypothetical protein [Butyrivibrio sp.]
MRLTRIIPLLLCTVLLTACTNTNNTQQDNAIPINDENETEIQETELEAENIDLKTEEVTDEGESKDLYESFLRNEAKVHINIESDFGYYYSFENYKDQDMSLEEIVNAIIASYIADNPEAKIWLENISYSYIDCGNDSIPELAIMIYTPMSMESWEQYIIIKEIDGTLQTVYSDVAWSRSSIYMNEYGYIFGDGSGGAAYHSYDKSFIDADGKWHFIYSDSSTAGIVPGGYGGDLWFNGDSHMVPEDTQLDGEYAFLSFDFNNTIDDDSDDIYTYAKLAESTSDDWGNGFRGYFYTDLVNDDTLYEDSHPLKQFFNNEGLHIYTLNEINQMIADKEAAEGLTEDIKNGKNVEWQNLEYDFEPYIATLNDDNFLERKEYFPLHFSLCSDQGMSTNLNINADGSIEGSFSNYSSNEDGSSTTDRNEYTGQIVVENKLSDTIYELRVSDYAVANEVGTSETHDYGTGSISTINFVDVPGFTAGVSGYYLYCPGTKKNEIDERALTSITDYYIEQIFEGEELISYILYDKDSGNDYTWRISW